MAARFRMKPVEVDAVQFDGTSFTADSIVRWIIDGDGTAWTITIGTPERIVVVIDTLEGRMQASEGDWVIRGVQGEHYPCPSDAFTATFDRVEWSEP